MPKQRAPRHDSKRKAPPTPRVPTKPVAPVAPEGHEGATDSQVGDRTGPGAGYDDEPEQVKDKGGVAQ